MNQKDRFENNKNQNSNWVANINGCNWSRNASYHQISECRKKKMNFKMNLMYEVGMEKKSNLKYKF